MVESDRFHQDINDLEQLNLKKVITELKHHQSEIQEQNNELHAIQNQLSESKDRYQMLFDHAPVAYLSVDQNGVILERNMTFSSLVRDNRQPVIGNQFNNFIDPAFQDLFYKYQLQQKTSPNQNSLQVKLKDGITKGSFVQIMSQLVQSNNDWIWYITLTDITEQILLEQKISDNNIKLEKRIEDRARRFKESRDEITSILNAVADAVITIDQKGNILSCNQATCNMFDLSSDSLVNMSIENLLPELDQSTLQRTLEIVRQVISAQPKRHAYQGRRRDGSAFSLDIAICRIDHVDTYTCVLRDVSEIKKLQREVLQATEVERNRISRDLHDSLGQSLSGMSMLARSFSTSFREKWGDASSQFLGFSKDLDGCIKHLRQIIHNLSPIDIEEQGLVSAIQLLCRATQDRHGVKCHLNCDTPIEFYDNEIQLHLLRIVQEAIHNAVKHAAASSISITLRFVNDTLKLTIKDDGNGFKGSLEENCGQGLKIMKYRADLLGGKLLIEDSHGDGILIRCIIPYKGKV